jgi:hypothetical protein
VPGLLCLRTHLNQHPFPESRCCLDGTAGQSCGTSSIALDIGIDMLPPCQSVRHNILIQVYTFVNADMSRISRLPPKRVLPALDDTRLILHCHLQNSPSKDTTYSLWVVCMGVPGWQLFFQEQLLIIPF